MLLNIVKVKAAPPHSMSILTVETILWLLLNFYIEQGYGGTKRHASFKIMKFWNGIILMHPS